MVYDSTGKQIQIGNRVRFRGQEYTIKAFLPIEPTFGIREIEFNEPQHTTEVASEDSVDLI